jgi:circadian clock protein KaiC
MLTGSMRLAQEARHKAATLSRQREIERRQRELKRRRQALHAQIAAQRAQFEAEQDDLKRLIAQEQVVIDRLAEEQEEMGRSRKADKPAETSKPRVRRLTSRGGRI